MLQDIIDKFKADLLSQPLEDVVQRYVFTGSPFAFRDAPTKLNVLRKHLAQRLDVSEDNVIVVGSAQTGFSLDPNAFPREFHDGSDIDVLVVDEKLFDDVWHTILRWHYPLRGRELPQADWNWRKKRMDELYWGWFIPSEIRFEGLSRPAALQPLRGISTRWFNAFKGLALLPEFASRDVSGRLYRSWQHAMLYHVNGLRAIIDRLDSRDRRLPS